MINAHSYIRSRSEGHSVFLTENIAPCVMFVQYPLNNALERRLKKGRGAAMKADQARQAHEELVMLVAEKADKDAFRLLFMHYMPRLKSHLIKLGLESPQAEDVAQDVMVKVWNKAGQFNPAKARVSTWIFRIARNTFIDHTRKQKYTNVNVDDHMADMIAPERSDENIEKLQAATSIEKAMTALKPEQKKVISLSYFEDMSHSAIADHLSLPLGTVKSRIRMAFDVLRRELGDKA